MGFIDSNEFTLTCLKCGAKEEARVVQRGSSFGAHWSDPSKPEKFDADWRDNGAGGPVIVSARCRKCVVEATVD
jgi:hypothetical protein